MAKRLSNKARIQQKAEEAAAKKPKTTKKKTTTTKKKKTTKKKAAKVTRLKVVWIVFDAAGKEVERYPYPEKTKAYTKLEDLIKKKKGQFFVNAVKVPMEDD